MRGNECDPGSEASGGPKGFQIPMRGNESDELGRVAKSLEMCFKSP